MFLLLVCFSITLMFYYLNSLFFIFNLLFFMVFIIVYLFYENIVSGLFCLMVSLIYVGAMMIFIGYVCAISPNFLFVSNLALTYVFLVPCLFSMVYSFIVPVNDSSSYTMFDFFYSSNGFYMFFVVVFVLFLTLLMVSSYNFVPKGSFRSSNLI